jgi:hypothetical protein
MDFGAGGGREKLMWRGGIFHEKILFREGKLAFIFLLG